MSFVPELADVASPAVWSLPAASFSAPVLGSDQTAHDGSRCLCPLIRGNLKEQVKSLHSGNLNPTLSAKAGINWENVSKRILPQLIYKGHVLRREPLCTKGMFFICPKPVHERIITRLGGNLQEYHPQPGSLTFRWYDLAAGSSHGSPLPLKLIGQKTTTIDQVANAFTSPQNLPDAGVYEKAIAAVLID